MLHDIIANYIMRVFSHGGMFWSSVRFCSYGCMVEKLLLSDIKVCIFTCFSN